MRLRVGRSSGRAEAPGASRRRGRRGGSGRSGPFGRSAIKICRFRSVPKRGFAFSSTSRGAFRPANPGLSRARSDRFRRLGPTERLSLCPMDGRETPIRRRAACPGTGVAVPDGAGPRPRSLTRETRPCVSGSEGRDRNIFRICQGLTMGKPAISFPARGRSKCTHAPRSGVLAGLVPAIHAGPRQGVMEA